eukprot:gene32480-17715_t
MLNSIALQGARVVQGRGDNLHVSGHAHQDALLEMLSLTFLPVHGEYSFLCEHARIAKEHAGVNYTEVIKNGTLLGCGERNNRNSVSQGSAQILGEANLVNFYNDGGRGTGNQEVVWCLCLGATRSSGASVLVPLGRLVPLSWCH